MFEQSGSTFSRSIAKSWVKPSRYGAHRAGNFTAVWNVVPEEVFHHEVNILYKVDISKQFFKEDITERNIRNKVTIHDI